MNRQGDGETHYLAMSTLSLTRGLRPNGAWKPGLTSFAAPAAQSSKGRWEN